MEERFGSELYLSRKKKELRLPLFSLQPVIFDSSSSGSPCKLHFQNHNVSMVR